MRNKKILKLVQNAMLSAIILLLTLTPLGYLPIGPLEVTVMMIPVAIGAMTLGISSGVILGGVFGLSSFLTCLGILRPSSFGQMLFAHQPVVDGNSLFYSENTDGTYLCASFQGTL